VQCDQINLPLIDIAESSDEDATIVKVKTARNCVSKEKHLHKPKLDLALVNGRSSVTKKRGNCATETGSGILVCFLIVPGHHNL